MLQEFSNGLQFLVDRLEAAQQSIDPYTAFEQDFADGGHATRWNYLVSDLVQTEDMVCMTYAPGVGPAAIGAAGV